MSGQFREKGAEIFLSKAEGLMGLLTSDGHPRDESRGVVWRKFRAEGEGESFGGESRVMGGGEGVIKFAAVFSGSGLESELVESRPSFVVGGATDEVEDRGAEIRIDSRRILEKFGETGMGDFQGCWVSESPCEREDSRAKLREERWLVVGGIPAKGKHGGAQVSECPFAEALLVWADGWGWIGGCGVAFETIFCSHHAVDLSESGKDLFEFGGGWMGGEPLDEVEVIGDWLSIRLGESPSIVEEV